MDKEKLKELWKFEESHAFQGWDFSYLKGRWDDERIPWDYDKVIREYRNDMQKLLDMGTGGGEFLLTLEHPYSRTFVTESYPPNVELCCRKLEPLGITVKQIFDDREIPYENNYFDIILNRHEAFELSEVRRVLKTGGLFITQQVGAENDRDLAEMLLPDYKPVLPEAGKENTLENTIRRLENLGMRVRKAEESFTPIKFFDVGALVYFAKIIEWEFPDFTVERCFDNLCRMQEMVEKDGFVEGTEHRFLVVAEK